MFRQPFLCTALVQCVFQVEQLPNIGYKTSVGFRIPNIQCTAAFSSSIFFSWYNFTFNSPKNWQNWLKLILCFKSIDLRRKSNSFSLCCAFSSLWFELQKILLGRVVIISTCYTHSFILYYSFLECIPLILWPTAPILVNSLCTQTGLHKVFILCSWWPTVHQYSPRGLMGTGSAFKNASLLCICYPFQTPTKEFVSWCAFTFTNMW